MQENMPDISFERSMNHNYMILSKCSFFGKDDDKSKDYRMKMLLENHIAGLLPVTHRLINGESRYYYEINSLQSLDRLYAKTEMRYAELRRLLSGCVNLFDRLEEYLLDGTQIIIKPELIYINVERMEPYFVCYPDYEGDVRVNFMEFIDELLTRIDHTDEHAVMLGYQIYRYTRNPNYVISEIGNIMEHVIVNRTDKQSDSARQGMELSKNGMSYVANSGIHTEADLYERGVCSRLDVGEVYSCDSEEDAEIPEKNQRQKTKCINDLIGGIFCIFVSLCSGAIILGARVIHTFNLGSSNELYLYGAMGMAIVGAVLFFSCYIKKRKQDKETEVLNDESDCGDAEYYISVENDNDSRRNQASKEQNLLYGIDKTDREYCAVTGIASTEKGSTQRSCLNSRLSGQSSRFSEQSNGNETVYLGDSIVEERMLCGRINGREVHISLNQLPMTIGKLANVSDFVINDTTVSKMHARFEESGGRVYICDLNSTNGTVYNGELLGINQSVVLNPGDRLRFGRTSFTYY